MELFYLLSVVALFSVVQSFIGVGLLLFGTPTLLIMGYPYDVTLWILVPSSIVLSIKQSVDNYAYVTSHKMLYIYTIPILMLSLVLIIIRNENVDISKIVGVVLILDGFIRYSKRLYERIKYIMTRNIRSYYMMMGVIHGISNMGGGPLTILMSSIHDEKVVIRANIAYIYMIFGASQLVVLSFAAFDSFNMDYLVAPLIALLIYTLVEISNIDKIKVSHYQSIITMVILFYGFISILS